MAQADSQALSGAAAPLPAWRRHVDPYLAPVIAFAKDAAAFLDKRVPHIRGRPALSELAANVKPGLTVALVSLPLSISLALAADATPVQGIITAAWAGLTSAFFGGSHYNVVGPTGALSGVLSAFSITYGPAIQPLLAILAGLMSLAVWLLGLERFFVFIPSAVMHGFTLGVAFIIAVNQLNFILGLPALPRHESFLANVAESLRNLALTNWLAVIFFIFAFGSLYTLSLRYGKIPWSIVLAGVGIIIGWLQGLRGPIATILSRYGDLNLQLVQVSAIFTTGLNISLSDWVSLLTGAASICVIAVLETLISAAIADRLTKTLFAQSREVMAVGLANLASGLAGGIPATAALARTALNIKSGATSRAAGIVSGLSIIILSTALFGLFKFLPLPVIAAILVNVAIKMIEWPEIIQLYHMDKPMFAVALVVMFVCIVEDPTMGIVIGALLAQIRILFNMRDAHAMLTVYAGRAGLLSMLIHQVGARKAVAAIALKYAAEVTPEARAAALGGGAAARDRDRAALAAAAAALSGDGAAPSSATTTLAAAASTAAAAADGARRAAGGRRASAVGADVLTAAPAAARDGALPLLALYSFPGYFTYVSAQVHRDRLRALFMPAAGEAARAMPAVRTVVLSLEDVFYADPDALETCGTLIEELTRAGYEVYLLGFKPLVFRAACKVHHLHEVRFFADYHQLLRFLRRQVGADGVYVRPPPLEAKPHAAEAGGAGAAAAAAGGHGHGAAAPASPARTPAAAAAAAAVLRSPETDAAWAAAAASSTPGAAAAAAAAGTRALGTRSVRTKSDIDSEWRPPSASASTATTARDAASTARSGGWGEGPPGIAQSGGAH